jgi:hypothetical protein
MVDNERVRVALKVAKSEGIGALPQSEPNLVEQSLADNHRRRDAARENAKFIAVFLSGINALQLVNGGVVYVNSEDKFIILAKGCYRGSDDL